VTIIRNAKRAAKAASQQRYMYSAHHKCINIQFW